MTGLLIKENEVIAGTSAKKAATKIETVKKALFNNEEDLDKHIDYIHYNSMKHYGIAPKNWEFSSFHRFVENGYYGEDWCNFEDKNKIKQIVYSH